MASTEESLPQSNRFISVGEIVIGEKERAYINRALDASRLSYGPITERFESLFAEIHDCKHAIFCSSGTSALHMALGVLKEARGWSDDDEVIVPATTFVATANVVYHCRMRAAFADVDRETYNVDPAQIEKRITKRTRAIIPVHLVGLPAAMDDVNAIADKHGLEVIEDSCETMFARYKGRSVGSLGAIGCFSTYVAHYIVAGIGGFATTNDDDLAIRMRCYMNHGRDPIYLRIDDDQNVANAKLHEIAARRFSFISAGHNFRATELEAAIGLAQLEDFGSIKKRRVEIAHRFIAGLEDLSDHIQLPTVPEDREHVFMLFPIVLKDREKQDMINYLEDRRIETRDLLPLMNQPIIKSLYGDIAHEYPVASWLLRSGFYVGCHQYLTDAQVDRVIATIHEFFAR
ncbi:MAG: DegT/DnrJ/EryC1/StrS family aminotransferase [Planctomycetes bacterium]|nr:DegT/DnrJ/EryC1/StrS family aminotransferase [Planctomycetota bacterium]